MRILKSGGFSKGSRVPLSFLLAVVVALTALGISSERADAAKKMKMEKTGSGYLGVALQGLTEDIIDGMGLKIQRGVLVKEVFEDSPAEEAGIRDGDIIIDYDGTKVATPADIIRLVQDADTGDEVQLKILRDGRTKTVDVTIGERPRKLAYDVQRKEVQKKLETLPEKWITVFEPRAQLGVKILDLEDEDLAEYFGVDQGEGVLVLGVTDDSAAEKAGVKAGDVIVELNRENINSSEELIDEVQEMDDGDDFDLVVIRHGKHMTLSGEMEKADQNLGMLYKGHELSTPRKWTQRFHVQKDDLEDVHKNLENVYRLQVDQDVRKELKELKKEVEELKHQLKKQMKKMEED